MLLSALGCPQDLQEDYAVYPCQVASKSSLSPIEPCNVPCRGFHAGLWFRGSLRLRLWYQARVNNGRLKARVGFCLGGKGSEF